jgi:putative endonuclease
MNRRRRGLVGESHAESFLKKLNYQILARNFRSLKGEIDIVALDGRTVVFTEVKTWNSLSTDALEYSLNGIKQRRILNAAHSYLLQNPDFRDYAVRFDVILLTERMKKILHLQNAFGEGNG